MKMLLQAGTLVLLAATAMLPTLHAADGASGAEYFVGPAGSDAQDGRTEAAAFATLQRGLDALQPGDTLTLLPGEYVGTAARDGLGDAAAGTRIRAKMPGTVLIRGNVPAPPLNKVDGYRFVYAAQFAGPAFAVLELDTLSILERQVDVAAVEFMPGSFFFDAERQMLYLSTTDLQPPDLHRYAVGIHDRSGLHLTNPRRVTVEGIAATGFFPGREVGGRFEQSVGGIMLEKAVDCVVRNCTAYLNGNGIALVRGDGNRIEHCVAYANYSPYHLPSGNIISYHGGNEVISNCVAYGGGEGGLEFYGTFPAPVQIENSLAWGNSADDIRIKGGGPGLEESWASYNVGPTSTWSVKNVRHNIVGGRNAYNPEMSEDNVMLPGSGLNWHQEFADPDNMDFRLQATSSLRAGKANGRDRGAFQFAPDVYFVKPDGDDAADGLSVRRAWRTLDHALQKLKAGDTLYLLAGQYRTAAGNVKLQGTPDQPVRIAARGNDRVRIVSDLNLQEPAHLEFQRLFFAGAVVVDAGQHVAFSQCRFAGPETGLRAAGTSGLRVTHCEFAGFSRAGLALDGGQDAFLAGNLFDNPPQVAAVTAEPAAVAHSDYNAFRSKESAWNNGLPPDGFERFSRQSAVDIAVADDSFAVGGAGILAGAGPLGKPVGTFPSVASRKVRLAGPFVHSVTDTTANIEWWTSQPARCEIAWGDSPACDNQTTLWSPGFASFSLAGLEPGREYFFQVRELQPEIRVRLARTTGGATNAAPVAFRTATAPPAARTLHVAVDGSDAADGLSPATAWRSLNRAAGETLAGDTVLIGGGEYHGTVWIRGSGDTGRPIRWQAAPEANVILNGLEREVRRGFVVSGKKAVHFDGFRLEQFGLGSGMAAALPTGGFVLRNSDDIQITRCFMSGLGGYSPPMLTGSDCRNVLVKNCVITANFYGIQVEGFDQFTIENSVFLVNSIAAAIIVNQPEQKVAFRNNVVTDSIPIKRTVQLFEIPHIDSIVQENNCFFLRVPPADRENLALFYQSAGRMTLPEWFEHRGANGSVAANPRFAAMPELPEGAGDDAFLPDLLVRKPGLDFRDLLITDPELLGRGVGLQPDAFPAPPAPASTDENSETNGAENGN